MEKEEERITAQFPLRPLRLLRLMILVLDLLLLLGPLSPVACCLYFGYFDKKSILKPA